MADAWRTATSNYLSSLDNEQLETIYAYKDYSDYFNVPLRTQVFTEESSGAIDSLTDIILNSPRSPNLWVYRAYSNFIPQVGQTIIEKGFVSTSLDVSKAMTYIEGNTNSSLVKFMISSNFAALYVDANVEHEDSDEEIILLPNITYTITSYDGSVYTAVLLDF